MNTPICDFVGRYADEGKVRMHMPGHKGACILGAEPRDITEIDGADVLYDSHGIIRESEDNAAELFGTARTVYSTEGSSLAIRAMLFLAMQTKKGSKRATVLAARNAHKAFVSAAALLDLDVRFMYSEKNESIVSCDICAQEVDAYLSECDITPAAVYLTSPDYLGNRLDIKGIAEVCHRHGTLLIVDNAHGAYLRFLKCSEHPIDLGADMCCDSAHKTLPVLTGGAYLHISKNAPRFLCGRAESAMALFASTSPSYLILQSLDMANKYISDGYYERLGTVVSRLDEIKHKLLSAGFELAGDEPLKLTVAPKSYGYTGAELAGELLLKGIVCEFSDADYAVMMTTPENSEEELARLEDALLSLQKRPANESRMPALPHPERAVSIREAALSSWREVDVGDSVGEVLAQPSVSCPPAVPIVVCGERIDERTVSIFRYYGIERCKVVSDGMSENTDE